MNWIDPYTFLLSALGLSVIFLSFALLRPPRRLSRTLLACATGLAGVFIILTVIELLIANDEMMLTLRNFQQISLVLTPFFLLGYAKELHHEAPRKTIRFISILVIPSIVDLILIFTDGFHGLMRESVTVKAIWGYTEVSTQSTLLNSLLGVYPFVILVLTVFLLIRNMFDIPKHYRRIHLLSALVIALPITALIIGTLLSIEIPGMFALSNCCMALLLILVNKEVDFNEIWPVSRQEVIDHLSEGILLIDQSGKVIEMNKTCCRMMKQLFNIEDCVMEVVHEPARSVFQSVSPLIEALEKGGDHSFQYVCRGAYFDINVTTLGSKSNDLRMVVWKDVTDKKEIELQLKELAMTDSLTKLTNREAFIDLYNEQLHSEESCFMLMDIDHFKKINDTYGHLIGDTVLRSVANLMKVHFTGDVVTRLGGEEFGVLLKVNEAQAYERAKVFQTALKAESYQMDPVLQQEVTVSIGICPISANAPFEKVYHKADEAMYQAKHDGRDCIRIA